MASDICRPSVWNLIQFNLLASRILNGLLDFYFFKFMNPWDMQASHRCCPVFKSAYIYTQLTNTMVQSASWKAYGFSDSQEIPRPHFMLPEGSLTHSQRSPVVPVLIQNNPVHAAPSLLGRIHFVLFSHLRLVFPSGLYPSGFPSRKTICTSLLPYTCYMPIPSHWFGFHHPNIIWWA